MKRRKPDPDLRLPTILPAQLIPLSQNQAKYADVIACWKTYPKLKAEDVSVLRCPNAVPGMVQYVAVQRLEPTCVLGLVLGVSVSSECFQVRTSYVEPWCRRKGVRTLIQDAILQDYAVVTSPWGSASGGEAWMRAYGYQYDAAYGWWVCRRKA